jgi:hypothetical protein
MGKSKNPVTLSVIHHRQSRSESIHYLCFTPVFLTAFRNELSTSLILLEQMKIKSLYGLPTSLILVIQEWHIGDSSRLHSRSIQLDYRPEMVILVFLGLSRDFPG